MKLLDPFSRSLLTFSAPYCQLWIVKGALLRLSRESAACIRKVIRMRMNNSKFLSALCEVGLSRDRTFIHRSRMGHSCGHEFFRQFVTATNGTLTYLRMSLANRGLSRLEWLRGTKRHFNFEPVYWFSHVKMTPLPLDTARLMYFNFYIIGERSCEKSFTFMWPCIVTNFFVIRPTRCTNFANFIFGMKLYMFRTVPLSIISSSFTVHSAVVYVIQVCRQLSSRIRMERNSVLILLESCLQTCMTYTTAECTVNELLMMERGTVRNM